MDDPGLERQRQPWVIDNNINPSTLKGFVATNPLQGLPNSLEWMTQGWSVSDNPGLTLANAFGVSRTRGSHLPATHTCFRRLFFYRPAVRARKPSLLRVVRSLISARL